MRRREFITFLGGAAAAWPLAASAQQAGGTRRIGVLMAYPESDPEGQALVAAFRGGLRKLGWTDGHSVRIDVGSVTPSALAVFRFTTNSNCVVCSTGRSAAFAPRRIFPMNEAARRIIGEKSTP